MIPYHVHCNFKVAEYFIHRSCGIVQEFARFFALWIFCKILGSACQVSPPQALFLLELHLECRSIWSKLRSSPYVLECTTSFHSLSSLKSPGNISFAIYLQAEFTQGGENRLCVFSKEEPRTVGQRERGHTLQCLRAACGALTDLTSENPLCSQE